MRTTGGEDQLAPVSIHGKIAEPLLHATAGLSGTIRAVDYRDEWVFAAYRPISPTHWGVVVKQNVDETLAMVKRLQNTMLIGMIVLLTIGMVLIYPLIYTAVRPLRELEKATHKVANGDLNTRVPIETEDEVGKLARSFNVMVDQVSITQNVLERKNRELSSFAYVVSHDLKAPLRAIDNLSTWLEEDMNGNLNEGQKKQMGLMRGRVHRMGNLIDGLLEYSRVGRINNPVHSVEVDTLLASVIDTVNPPDTIKINISSDMPTLETDEIQLGQVCQNLLENAVKYHPGPEGRVDVNCRDSGKFWEFSVSDDGKGIAPRHQERIFQIFQTLQSRDEIESTGIGLSLVKKIVEERGGSVWVESEGVPGKGTTFKFLWPKGNGRTGHG